MLAMEGLKLVVGLFAVSLILFAVVPELGALLTLAKMVAASFGISLLFVLLYPRVRGVKKGDTVQVMKGALSRLFGFTGTVQDDCRVGGEVRVKLPGGREAVGVLESYEGLFTPPRVKLVYEKKAEVMR